MGTERKSGAAVASGVSGMGFMNAVWRHIRVSTPFGNRNEGVSQEILSRQES
jgi:hypothetical protein